MQSDSEICLLPDPLQDFSVSCRSVAKTLGRCALLSDGLERMTQTCSAVHVGEQIGCFSGLEDASDLQRLQ